MIFFPLLFNPPLAPPGRGQHPFLKIFDVILKKC